MTFEEYIKNPMGKNNSVATARELIRNMYVDKWNKIKLREDGNINYVLYKAKDEYILHMKIPSETVDNFYYDIVLKFFPKKHDKSMFLSKSLSDYEVKFFSNDPAFIFTYAHSFIKKDMFFEDIQPKMSKLAVKRNANEKNPNNDIGYVKTFYFAYLEMKNRNLFNKSMWVNALHYDKKVLLNNVEEADTKISDRQSKQTKKKDKPSLQKNTRPSPNNDLISKHIIQPIQKIVGKSKITGKPKINGIKKK